MPEPTASTDFGTRLLELLEALLIPDWTGLIPFLPWLLLFGLLGPALTLMLLYYAYVSLKAPRGRVRTDEPQPVAATHAPDGTPAYPPNTPYCPRHELLYPATTRNCEIDGDELLVNCPVDGTTRVASQSLCRGCGTRFELGASMAPVVVRRQRRPPDGGAAIA